MNGNIVKYHLPKLLFRRPELSLCTLSKTPTAHFDQFCFELYLKSSFGYFGNIYRFTKSKIKLFDKSLKFSMEGFLHCVVVTRIKEPRFFLGSRVSS